MYWSHRSIIGHLNNSNANSTCCLHSWHEEIFVQLANKKTPLHVTSFWLEPMAEKLKPSPIHSKMLSLFPPLIKWHRADCKPCTNMNIFRISTLLGVCYIHFAFYILQIATVVVFASSLLCAHGNSGKTFCKNKTPQKMWYIKCHPQVICSMLFWTFLSF